MFKANSKDTRMTLPLFGLNMQIYQVNHHILFKYERRQCLLMSLLLTLNIFHTLF